MGGRCRVIVLDPNGKQEVSFKWGLGGATNNQAEALALYQGLKILDPRQIMNLTVIGDSAIIIRLMRCSSSCDGNLARLIL
jgi:ribonuclease HI